MEPKSHSISRVLSIVLVLLIAGCQSSTSATPTVDDAVLQQTAIAEAANATLTAQVADPVVTEVPTEAVTPELIATESPSSAPTTDPASIVHTTTPNVSTSGVLTVVDTNTLSMANQGRAMGGDDYSQNLFERPFAADGMVYHPELDIQTATLGYDSTFYYVTITLAGTNTTTHVLDGTYGIELDVDADGTGDYMVLAFPTLTNTWSTTTLWAGSDANGDIGGLHPMQADAPEGSDGYEHTLFVYDQGTDPDIAWARLGTQPNTVQIAFKKSLISGGTQILWSVWANGGEIDIAQEDLNDNFLPTEAGSPIQGVAYFPLNQVDLLDNTCRMAIGFTPVGNEPGLCSNLRASSGGPTVTVTSTLLPVTTVAPTEPVATVPPATGSMTIFLFTDTNGNGVDDSGEGGYPGSDVETVITLGSCPGTTVVEDYYRGGATMMPFAPGWYCVTFHGPHTITPVSTSSFSVTAGVDAQINFGVVP